jgi:hypothetical protein
MSSNKSRFKFIVLGGAKAFPESWLRQDCELKKAWLTIGLLATILYLNIETGQARCGETLSKCITRFGQPLTEKADPSAIGESIVEFKCGNFVVSAIFQKGIVVADCYSKADEIALTDEEKKTLLDAEAGGDTWEIYEGLKFDQVWIKKDGAMAILSHNRLLCVTKGYLYAVIAQKKAQDSIFHF